MPLSLTSPPRALTEAVEPKQLVRRGYLDTQSGPLGTRQVSPRDPAGVLALFWAGLATRTSLPCDIVVEPGDSISEGEGATTRANRWIERLLALIRAAFPTPSIPGGLGYTPAMNISTTFPNGFSYAGNVAGNGTFGIGRRSIVLKGADGEFTTAVYGTSVIIHHTVATGLGSFQVFLDGSSTPARTVDTAAGGSGTARDVGRAVVNLGTRGNHTVRVRWSSGGDVYIGGLWRFDQDESAGIRLVDGGQHGSTSANWTDANGYLISDHLNGALGVSPRLVLVGLGPNDMIQGLSSTGYKANMVALISQIRAAAPLAAIVIHAAYTLASPDYAEPWQAYLSKLREIVAADSGVHLIDMSVLLPPATLGSYGLIAADGVHLSDAGHDLYARTLFEQLVPPAVRAQAVGLDQLGAAGGAATLDGNGRLPLAQMTNHAHFATSIQHQIVSLTDAAAGGTVSIDASTGSLFRGRLTGSTATLAVPTGVADGRTINVELYATTACTLTLASGITLVGGQAGTIDVPGTKLLSLALRYRSATTPTTLPARWRLLAATVDN